MNTSSSFDSGIKEILLRKDTLLEAARMFLKNEWGEPLADVGVCFNAFIAGCGIPGRDLAYVHKGIEITIQHLKAAVALHEALLHKKTFLEIAPGFMHPTALMEMQKEIADIEEYSSEHADSIRNMVEESRDWLGNYGEVITTIRDLTLQLDGNSEDGVPYAGIRPHNKTACVTQWQTENAAVLYRYNALIARELEAMFNDLGFFTTLYGRKTKLRVKDYDSIDRETYCTQYLSRQIKDVNAHWERKCQIEAQLRPATFPVFSSLNA